MWKEPTAGCLPASICADKLCLVLPVPACVSVSVSPSVHTHLLDTYSAVLHLAAMDLFHCISLSFYVFVFSPLPICFAFFFFFSLVRWRCCSLLSPSPLATPLWHHGWLCPIRSAAGEGGEWDAGCSESGAGSHHTVLRPWNVSGTTTAATNRAASLPPFSVLLENYHTRTSLNLWGAISVR